MCRADYAGWVSSVFLGLTFMTEKPTAARRAPDVLYVNPLDFDRCLQRKLRKLYSLRRLGIL